MKLPIVDVKEELLKLYNEYKYMKDDTNRNRQLKHLLLNMLKVEECPYPLYENMVGICFIDKETKQIYGYRNVIDKNNLDGLEVYHQGYSKNYLYKAYQEIFIEFDKDINEYISVKCLYRINTNQLEIYSKDIDEYKELIINYFNIKDINYICIKEERWD